MIEKIKQLFFGQTDKSIAGRSAIFAFLIRVGGAGIAFLSQIILARWLGESEYGIFAYVWVWVLLLGGLCTLGLNTAIIRFLPEYEERGEFHHLRGVVARARQITLFVSTIIMLIGLLFVYLYSEIIGSPYVLPLFIALFCLPAYGITDLHDSMARGYSKMILALSPPFIIRPMLILLLMLAAWLFAFEMTAKLAISCALIACWITGVIQFFWLRGALEKPRIPHGEKQFKTSFWMKTALPVLLVESFLLMLQNTDILILQLYREPAQLGLYYAALKTINLITFVHFAVSNAVANRFSAYNARGAKEELAAFMGDAIKWTFWPSFLGAVILLLLGKPLLYLFGSEFTSAYSVMVILAIGLVIKSMFGPAEFLLNMLGQERLCAMILFGTVVLNIILNFLLIPPYGINGAATATSISLAMSGFIFFFVVRSRLDMSIVFRPGK